MKKIDLSLQAVALAKKRKNLPALNQLADQAHNAHLPEVALAALEALAALGDRRPMLLLKRGQILSQFGRNAEALELLADLVAQQPDSVIGRELLANAHMNLMRDDLALPHLHWLAEQVPSQPGYWVKLARTLENIGERAQAQQALERVLAADADHVGARAFWPLVAQERTPQTAADTDAAQARFVAHVGATQAWLAAHPELRPAFARAFQSYGPFALAYSRADITPALRAWGQLAAAVFADGAEPTKAPTKAPDAAPRTRIRLGIFTRQLFRQSVFFILLQGFLRRIDRSLFEVVVFSNSMQTDDQTQWAKTQVDRWYDPRPDWHSTLVAEACDVLYYPDSTMDGTSVYLTMQRLAPLQATTWGHPVSSGLSTLDIFFSGQVLEPPQAQQHYVEHLVCLPGTGATTPALAFEPTTLPDEVEAALAASTQPLALVAHNAFKLHPADDALWLRLARTYPGLRIAFFKKHTIGPRGVRAVERLQALFAAHGLGAQLLALPWLTMQQFNSLLQRVDLYLDPTYFSGFTTALQAALAGTPIVTIEGPFMRQRLASGLLRAIGCTDTIAHHEDEYVAIVGRLLAERAHQPAAWQQRWQALRAAAPRVCNDERPVPAMERVFLEELAARAHPTAQQLLQQHRAQHPHLHYQVGEHSVAWLPPVLAPAPAAAAAATEPPSAAHCWQLLGAEPQPQALAARAAPVALLELIAGTPQAVFDLGCWSGASGRWLRAKFPDARVIGCEPQLVAAEQARAHYHEVHAGPLETMPLAGCRQGFDAIIAADVLQQHANPWATLQRLQHLIAPGGSLYLSLPNVRNLRLLEALAKGGDWPYQHGGALDVANLRFFSCQSATRMLEETGWQVLETRCTLDPQLQPHLAGADLKTIRNIELASMTLRDLAPGEAVELFALQWLFRCVPNFARQAG